MEEDILILETSETLTQCNKLKSEMLQHISKNTEAHFKSQQCGEPDLTQAEKLVLAEKLLDRSRSLFLAKYGKYLEQKHLEYFEGSEDYDINYYLKEYKTKNKKSATRSQVRNRRLEAMRRLCLNGEYFSDLEMRRRNPLLYEELVGQYLTAKEKIENEANSTTDPTVANVYFDIMEKGFENSRLKQEILEDFKEMQELTDEETTPQNQVALWGEMSGSSADSSTRVLNNSRHECITTDQKNLLLQEFRSHVFSNFLVGKDKEFDYSQVDSNNDYDDLDMMEIDQQDNYFDSESPKTICDSDEDSSRG